MTKSKKIGAFSSGQKKWKGTVRNQRMGGDKANFNGNKCILLLKLYIITSLIIN